MYYLKKREKKMALINIEYARAENLTAEEKKELGITVDSGLIAIETSNPEIKDKGVVVENYVDYLLNLGN